MAGSRLVFDQTTEPYNPAKLKQSERLHLLLGRSLSVCKINHMATPAMERRGDKNAGNLSLNGVSRWQIFKPDSCSWGIFFWFFGDVLFPPSTLGVSKLGSPQGIGGSILVVRTWLQGNGFPHFAVQTSSKPTSHLWGGSQMCAQEAHIRLSEESFWNILSSVWDEARSHSSLKVLFA